VRGAWTLLHLRPLARYREESVETRWVFTRTENEVEKPCVYRGKCTFGEEHQRARREDVVIVGLGDTQNILYVSR
jgi:hypothetical protein